MAIICIKYAIPASNNENTQCEQVDREILVNIDCPLKLILNYIRKEVGLNNSIEFDLCDDISCQLRRLSLFGPYTRGSDVLQRDTTYVPVTFERNECGQIMNVIPLLSGKAAKKCADVILRTQALFGKQSSNKFRTKKGSNTNRYT